MSPDLLTLTINGRDYSGWTGARVSRGIDRLATDFVVDTTQRWTGQNVPWRIDVFDACVVAIDGVPLLTGYVEEVAPRISEGQHGVQIAGRSKVADLIDCRPDIAGGQFTGYSLAAIARAVAALFGVGVIDQSNGLADNQFSDVTIQRGETAFLFLERLGRLSGVLLSDDVSGNLVLTTAGSSHAAGALEEGKNILTASARLNGRRRFSTYIVKGQTPIGGGNAGIVNSPSGAVNQSAPTVQVNVTARATDAGVPRFRPYVYLAESALQGAAMQVRANWLAQMSWGRATEAEVSLAGWRQPNGQLWTPNEIISTTLPTLGVTQDLLIAQVTFVLSETGGRQTMLRLAPVAAYTPDPGAVKLHRRKKGAGGSRDWAGAGGIP